MERFRKVVDEKFSRLIIIMKQRMMCISAILTAVSIFTGRPCVRRRKAIDAEIFNTAEGISVSRWKLGESRIPDPFFQVANGPIGFSFLPWVDEQFFTQIEVLVLFSYQLFHRLLGGFGLFCHLKIFEQKKKRMWE